MSTRQAKRTGWAAFDLQQRQKGIIEAQSSKEPFPSLSTTLTSPQSPETLLPKKSPSVKPFSSVVLSSANFPVSVGSKKENKPYVVGGGPRSSDVPQVSKPDQVLRQLKELYSWADDGLIQDILAAANNEFAEASSFLRAMFCEESIGKNKVNMVIKSSCDSTRYVNNDSQEISETPNTFTVFDSCIVGDNKNMRDELDFQAEAPTNSLLGRSTCVPIEPEWEEDDVYLSCRKDALKMMRAATRHSKAASNSFMKGDHFSAQQFSLKAREARETSERLNAKAAGEILRIRNENNGIWRLDLHGLHATEAIQALQERLHMIETQVFLKAPCPSGLPNSVSTKTMALHALPLGGGSDEQVLAARKPMWLEVITGIGNHSRGGAALPAAVQTFLVDNGYRFDEARAGVIVVRPKIRRYI